MTVQDFMADPLAWWAVAVGLLMATSVVLTTAVALFAVTIKALQLRSLRRTYTKIAWLLGEAASRNRESNPDLADLAVAVRTLLVPGQSVYDDDHRELRKRLNLPEAQEYTS